MTYLFTGPETGEKQKRISSILTALQKKYSAVDFHRFYAFETSSGEAVNSLMNGSLFSSAAMAILYNAELIKKKSDIEAIEDWSKSEAGKSESSVLILASEEIGVDKALEKAAGEKTVFWQMFEERKSAWLSSLFSRAGFKITGEATELFLELVENDTASLEQAANRFFAFFDKGKTITAEDVEKLLTHEREEDAFTLFSYIACRHGDEVLKGALSRLSRLRLSKDSSAVALIAGLSSCFRKLLLFHQLSDEGKTDAFSLKRSGFLSTKMQKQYQTAAKVWSKEAARRALASLFEADFTIRSGSDEERALELLLYSLVVKRGEPCAKHERTWMAPFY